MHATPTVTLQHLYACLYSLDACSILNRVGGEDLKNTKKRVAIFHPAQYSQAIYTPIAWQLVPRHDS